MTVLVTGSPVGTDGGTITITPPADTKLGLLIYSEGRDNAGLGTPTWNGNNMTLIVSEDGNAGDGGVEIYGYLNPTTGSPVSVVTGIADAARAYDRATALCLSGVGTSTAFGSYTTYQADGTGDAGADDISQTVAVPSGHLLIDGCGHFRISTASPTGTNQVDVDSGTNYGRSKLPSGNTSIKWDLDYGTSNAWGWAAVVVPSVSATETDVPLGILAITGYAPIVSPLVIEIPLGELTLTGYAPTVALEINTAIPLGTLTITGYAPLVGEEELLIRTADGGTLLGRLTDGTGVALFSDGENWYALALPKQGT